LTSYYEKAAGTPTGKKFANFYTQTQRQVLDIHNEARRLADLKKQEAAGVTSVPGSEKTTCKCGSISSDCPCEAGKCACSGCSKSDMDIIPGTDKTTCKCGGDDKNCPCEAGKCACSGCSK
jgi:hypothetical protein